MSRPTIRIPAGGFDLVMNIDGRDVLFVDVVCARVGMPDLSGYCRLELEARDVRRVDREPPRRAICHRCMQSYDERLFHVCTEPIDPSIFRNYPGSGLPPLDLEEIMRKLREAAFKPPPKPKPPPALTTWRTALGFAESERPALAAVKTRYRELITKAHPDAGGAHDAAVALNVAWTAAQKEIGR